jgi:hypothetical protein
MQVYTLDIKHLERLALEAHGRNEDWSSFHAAHRGLINALEPWDLDARRRLVRRLSLLVVAGDLHGSEPLANGWSEPMPWELDDGAQVVPHYPASDSETAARLQVDISRIAVQ